MGNEMEIALIKPMVMDFSQNAETCRMAERTFLGMVWLTKLSQIKHASLRFLTDLSFTFPKASQAGKKNKEFPTPEDIMNAIDLLASGRLRLRLFLKSLESIFGISDIQLDFIDLIGRKKAISPSDLAIELDVNKATISGHIEKLIEINLIQESPSPEDGRKKQLNLTDLGSNLYQFTNLIQSRVIQRLLTFIGPEIFAQVNGHLNTIVKTIDARKQAIKELIQTNPEKNMQTLMESPLEELMQKLSKIFPFLLGDIDPKSIPLEEIL